MTANELFPTTVAGSLLKPSWIAVFPVSTNRTV